MRTLSRSLVIAASVAFGAGRTLAQDITGFEDGYLTFTNGNPALYYRVEFKPNLVGPAEWDGRYSGLKNIKTNAAAVTVPVGVFYRVVGSTNPIDVGTAEAGDILAPKTVFVNGLEVTGTMPNVGAQAVTPGATGQAIQQGFHNGAGYVEGDADLVTENIRRGVTVFGVTGTMDSAAVPKTGQTNSFLVRDDGDLERGVPWPNPRFTVQADTNLVADNLTGLMWTRSANLPGGTRNWSDALAYCNNMNSGSGTYGYSDWRLPNVRELHSLIDFGRISIALPSGHPFTGAQSGYYWSSTPYAGAGPAAWNVNLGSGHVNGANLGSSYYVWPVRGAP